MSATGNNQHITITAKDGSQFDGYLALPERGEGPGLLLIQEIFGVNAHIRKVANEWAKEGYVVLAPDLFHRLWPKVELGYVGKDRETALDYYRRFDEAQGLEDLAAAVDTLRQLPQVHGGVAALGFCLGGKLAYRLAAHTKLEGVASYYGGGIDQHLAEAQNISCPMIFHFGELDQHITIDKVAAIINTVAPRGNHVFVYEKADHGFNCDARATYNQRAALLAKSRTVEMLHGAIGPRLDLGEVFDNHLFTSLGRRDLEGTLETLSEDAVVNFVPTLSGGRGKLELRHFYSDLFEALSGDATVTTISRTIGSNRVVDEVILSFTHDRPMNFILPGLKPTGRHVTIPVVISAMFCFDKLARENIYWDQASVLKQIESIDEDLKFGKLHLPVSGSEQASRLLDDHLKTEKVGSGVL